MIRQRSRPSLTARFLAGGLALAPGALCAQTVPEYGEFACRALACSTLVPSKSVDNMSTNDCGYRNGNEWWVDYVAGSLLWTNEPLHKRITVALFDDGALMVLRAHLLADCFAPCYFRKHSFGVGILCVDPRTRLRAVLIFQPAVWIADLPPVVIIHHVCDSGFGGCYRSRAC